MAKAKRAPKKSKGAPDQAHVPQTRGKNKAGQTNGQNEMTPRERGKGQNTSAGGAPRQTY